MPGVTLVSSTRPQAAGQRKPMTIATASSREMFPPISSAVASRTPIANSDGPVRNRTAASSSAVQTPMKTSQGRCWSGDTSCRKAGE